MAVVVVRCFMHEVCVCALLCTGVAVIVNTITGIVCRGGGRAEGVASSVSRGHGWCVTFGKEIGLFGSVAWAVCVCVFVCMAPTSLPFLFVLPPFLASTSVSTWANNEQKTKKSRIRASQDLYDFPSIFETAIADFRTLLSNSAFGDALLLKMVVICIFSVTHVANAKPSGSSPDARDEAGSNAGSSGVDGGGSSLDGVNSDRSTGTQAGGAGDAAASKAEEVRRNARLSYPLALAFGVSAQIGRHVRTQEPTHPSQGSQHGGHGKGHHRHGSQGSHAGSDGGMLQHHHQHQHHVSPPAPVVSYGVDSKTRPSSNQPQPRPLGSRLLGPVVLFCDWLTAQSGFLCLAEEERSSSGGGGGGRGQGVPRAGGRASAWVASVAVQEVRYGQGEGGEGLWREYACARQERIRAGRSVRFAI